jgi:hypothetical protein
MRFEHPQLPGRSVRLAYCLNLHGAEDFEGALRGMQKITVPLRDRLASEGSFGVGMYFPGKLATELAAPGGVAQRKELRAFLDSERLNPFTFNAFPYGDFHRAGLKSSVFQPTWCEQARVEYTIAVGKIAAELQGDGDGHVSISTHPGRFGAWTAGEFELATANLAQVLRAYAGIEALGGPRLRLSLEAEPRAVAGNMRELGELLQRFAEALEPNFPRDLIEAHLGACLDSCHASVEFESPGQAVESVCVLPLGKLQISSAITLAKPGENPAARQELFDLNEPRYLHQTTGRLEGEFLHATDLPEVQAACEDPNSPWLACDEWRTHFHVPINLQRLEGHGLETTSAHALATMRTLLDQPERWGSEQLHLEIETYTWDILPRSAGGGTHLVDGLEAEYEPVLQELTAKGWVLSPG